MIFILMIMNNDDYHEFQGLLKDAQICHLEKENELLRQQKESLMVALRWFFSQKIPNHFLAFAKQQ